MFKKKFKKFMCNLGKFFTFSFGFLGLFGLIALLGGWSTDGVGNLVSDNLYSGDKDISVSYDSINNRYYVEVSFNLIEVPNNETLYIYFDLTSNSTNWGVDLYNDNIYLSSTNFEDNIKAPNDDYYYCYELISSPVYCNKMRFYSDFYEDNSSLSCSYSNIMLSFNFKLYDYEPYNSIYYNPDNLGNISFNIEDYGVSVGKVPTANSFDYTLNEEISNDFTYQGYLDISVIYQNYIAVGSGSVNNTIYISTPVNNLLTFDMQFNFNTAPNVCIKTFLSLPSGLVQNFVFSADNFNYKENWSLSNFVAVSSISQNFDLNDISYVDILITYENIGDNLSSIKLGSNNGYNTGFEAGYNKGLEMIDFWHNLYDDLKRDYNALSSIVDSLKNQITQLNEQLDNTVGWKPFIFTMADTPFRVVSNVLGFEVFGVNLYKVLVGLITTLAILWLIRKLRK